jgi:hypothetical protein
MTAPTTLTTSRMAAHESGDQHARCSRMHPLGGPGSSEGSVGLLDETMTYVTTWMLSKVALGLVVTGATRHGYMKRHNWLQQPTQAASRDAAHLHCSSLLLFNYGNK